MLLNNKTEWDSQGKKYSKLLDDSASMMNKFILN